MNSSIEPVFSRNINRHYAVYSICFQRMVEQAFSELSVKYHLKKTLVYSHNFILQSLYYQENPLTLAEISKRSGQAMPNVSVAAAFLRENKLIVCKKLDNDHRKYSVSLSTAGRALCDDYVENYLPIIRNTLFEGFTSEEIDILWTLMVRLGNNARKQMADLSE